ncbi:uncharacterized protein H6S33_000278 [Morchella sextelata]|uniref:uncharacterized protein n=1 Tax=Morchella sextelata TaxID=1174677 RepID=UPI001D04A221|nr:uncharacterized protein H6S33_000278 [Morchella sextelata]KAH0614642.1 hypothetical protein H6S33_000278 [Morchella sextelata]
MPLPHIHPHGGPPNQGHPPPDHLLSIIGLVVAIISAVAGVLALFEGWKMWRKGKRDKCKRVYWIEHGLGSAHPGQTSPFYAMGVNSTTTTTTTTTKTTTTNYTIYFSPRDMCKNICLGWLGVENAEREIFELD